MHSQPWRTRSWDEWQAGEGLLHAGGCVHTRLPGSLSGP